MQTTPRQPSTNLVLKVGDAQVQDLQDASQAIHGQVVPPLAQERLLRVLQHPQEAHQQVPRRIRVDGTFAQLLGKKVPEENKVSFQIN